MVTAGFPATVAPLGTALTEEQLALLWKMADEPLLCFDGDKAGQRAAYRALDLALPKLLPGKSLKFALLPEGQDPDDLARSGGREADRRSADQRALALRHAVAARSANLAARYAGAQSGARSAHRRDGRRHRERNRAALLSRRFPGAAARTVYAATHRRHSRATARSIAATRRAAILPGATGSAADATHRSAIRSRTPRRGFSQARWCAAPRARCRHARRSFSSP